jgi:hypothetical protein
MANIKIEKAKASSPTAMNAVLVSGTKRTRRMEKTVKTITATVTSLAITYSLKYGRVNT